MPLVLDVIETMTAGVVPDLEVQLNEITIVLHDVLNDIRNEPPSENILLTVSENILQSEAKAAKAYHMARKLHETSVGINIIGTGWLAEAER